MIFYKYNALGNDFIFFEDKCILDSKQISLICRENEIGADGVVFISPSSKYDAKFEIYNKDGNRALVCGNALRALAYHLINIKKIKKDNFIIESGKEKYEIGKLNNEYYVKFKHPEIISISNSGAIIKAPNLHMIKLVDKIDIARLYEVGLSFKDYLNTHEIMKVNNNTFAFISFEKGVGLTDSCISGAISAYEFLNKINFGCQKMVFRTIGGDINLEGDNNFIKASGIIKLVYKGEIYEDYFCA